MSEQTKGAKWTPEPWEVEVVYPSQLIDVRTEPLDDSYLPSYLPGSAGKNADPEQRIADALRIVACVNAMQGIANPEAVAGLVEAAWAAAEELERLSDVRGHMATRRAWHGLLAALAELEQESRG